MVEGFRLQKYRPEQTSRRDGRQEGADEYACSLHCPSTLIVTTEADLMQLKVVNPKRLLPESVRLYLAQSLAKA